MYPRQVFQHLLNSQQLTDDGFAFCPSAVLKSGQTCGAATVLDSEGEPALGSDAQDKGG